MKSVLYTVMCLVVAVGSGVSATWLLIRIDRMTPGRRLGRRALMALSALAVAAEFTVGRTWLGGGAGVLSVFLMMALSMAWSAVHYVQRTHLWLYQAELALFWWIWIVTVGLAKGDLRGALTYLSWYWIIFAVFGGLALYPARRRHLRGRASADTSSEQGAMA